MNVQCFGECGCSVNLRKSKVSSAQYYLCGSKEHGHVCEAKLPPLPPGMVRRVEVNAAASFWGYTDEWPDAEITASSPSAPRSRRRKNAPLRVKKRFRPVVPLGRNRVVPFHEILQSRSSRLRRVTPQTESTDTNCTVFLGWHRPFAQLLAAVAHAGPLTFDRPLRNLLG
jgi:hypothetical protein